MSKLILKNINGDNIGDYDISTDLLETSKGNQAVHEAVIAFQAHQRAGTASTLSKSNVAGSGKKPWKQKGLGRARAGYKQSPIWRGGSVAHGPHPRTYKKKVSKKVSKLAFKHAFSAKISQNEVILLEELILNSPKTKEFASIISNLELSRSVLVVVDSPSENLLLASRNIPRIEIVSAKLLNTYQLLKYNMIVITKTGMTELEKRLI